MILATMTLWDWFLLAMATVVAAGIVKRSKLSNWMIIPVVLIVWVLSYVLIWVLKMTIVLGIIVGLGLILWYYIHKVTTPRPPSN